MGGIQTGLTDAQLLASQLKAHQLVGLEASASEIDNSIDSYLNVLNNGVLSDGSDITVALQTLLNKPSRSKDIYFPRTEQQYLHNGAFITVPKSTYGMKISTSLNTIFKTNYNSSSGSIRLGDGTYANGQIIIENFFFTGNTTLLNQTIMAIKGMGNVTLKHCTFNNAGGVGLLLDTADIVLDNCYFINSAIGLSINCTKLRGSGLRIINPHFQNCGIGLDIKNYSIDKLEITGGVFQGNGIAIQSELAYPMHLFKIDTVYFEKNGVDFIIGQNASSLIRNMEIKTCQFIINTAAQSFISNIQGFKLENNYFGSDTDIVYGGLNIDNTVTEIFSLLNKTEGRVQNDISGSGKQLLNVVAGQGAYNSVLTNI